MIVTWKGNSWFIF